MDLLYINFGELLFHDRRIDWEFFLGDVLVIDSTFRRARPLHPWKLALHSYLKVVFTLPFGGFLAQPWLAPATVAQVASFPMSQRLAMVRCRARGVELDLIAFL